jgi:hypothetical protein
MYNEAPQELLRSVPGGTAKNNYNLMMECENIQGVGRASEGEVDGGCRAGGGETNLGIFQ